MGRPLYCMFALARSPTRRFLTSAAMAWRASTLMEPVFMPCTVRSRTRWDTDMESVRDASAMLSQPRPSEALRVYWSAALICERKDIDVDPCTGAWDTAEN